MTTPLAARAAASRISVYSGILLFFAPLLGWLPELPYLRRMPRWARGLTRAGSALSRVHLRHHSQSEGTLLREVV